MVGSPLKQGLIKMNIRSLISSALIGAVASARSMTPMAMGVGELFGDKMTSARPAAA